MTSPLVCWARRLAVLVAAFALLTSQPAFAGGHHSGGGRHAALGVTRDTHGKIARSPEQKAAFKHLHPCPSTGRRSGGCPGYVIDHVMPLKRGGADRPENMHWQTKEAARAKVKTE